MLSVTGLCATYGKLEVLRQITLEVPSGRIVALVGANGAGKSTLVNAICGLVQPTAGDIVFEEKRLNDYRPHEIVRLGLAQVPEGRKVFASLTVAENLLLGGSHAFAKQRRRETLEDVLQLFPVLRERSGQRAGTLSGGEQQMLAIGRALMTRPKMLLFDEPSLGLAPLIVREVFRIIRKLNEGGMTILLIEQNVKQSLAICDRAYVLENGTIVLNGRGQDILNHEHVQRAYFGLRQLSVKS